ncbi:hypothetical protein [Citrobacter freundii]|uniref:Uncharacterized protein n=1 Tax=Citrobacter freundii TaxID=546 RepID=A0A7G2IQX5_CITFR|nr:hypothetical protein [Citrobacter freundii]
MRLAENEYSGRLKKIRARMPGIKQLEGTAQIADKKNP